MPIADWLARAASGRTFVDMNTAEEIIDFVRERMRMSHVYQPLLIRALVRAGGSATLRQLTTTLLTEDESQLLYYEDRIKKMPLPVLRGHDIVTSERDLISLNAPRLTYEQRAAVELACTQKLADFLQRRGLATWDYRLIQSDPVPTDARYQVLTAAKGRCALCGATSAERRIEVDHIIPRSRGGSNDITNLQALCDVCNRGKSNTDDTDFRILPTADDA
jgi:5-methylcytosine-specific restriction endonuclease McrA